MGALMAFNMASVREDVTLEVVTWYLRRLDELGRDQAPGEHAPGKLYGHAAFGDEQPERVGMRSMFRYFVLMPRNL
ncbi:MAG: hypothetical protein V1796_07780 [Pseudomonadota bacterium]